MKEQQFKTLAKNTKDHPFNADIPLITLNGGFVAAHGSNFKARAKVPEEQERL